MKRDFGLAVMFLGLLAYCMFGMRRIVAPGDVCSHIDQIAEWAGDALFLGCFGLSLWIVFETVADEFIRRRQCV